ncbi:MAG: hypothetical protein LDL07_02270 [Desulfarculus sp.]|nr:hypothetical protein [Desulfarculus sp.]
MRVINTAGELIYADRDCQVERHQGGRLVITHVRDIEPVMAEVARRRAEGNNGFSKGRTLRYLGSLPLSTLLARPELADPNELKKYLRAHPRLRAVAATSF